MQNYYAVFPAEFGSFGFGAGEIRLHHSNAVLHAAGTEALRRRKLSEMVS